MMMRQAALMRGLRSLATTNAARPLATTTATPFRAFSSAANRGGDNTKNNLVPDSDREGVSKSEAIKDAKGAASHNAAGSRFAHNAAQAKDDTPEGESGSAYADEAFKAEHEAHNKAETAAKEAEGYAKDKFDEAESKASELKSEAESKAGELKQEAKSKAGSVTEKVSEVAHDVKEGVQNIAHDLKRDGPDADDLKTIAENTKEGIKNKTGNIVSEDSKVAEVAHDVKEGMQNITHDLKRDAPDAEDLKVIAKNTKEAIKDKVGNLLGKAKSEMESAAETVKDTDAGDARRAAEKAKNTVESKAQDAKETVEKKMN